MSVECALWVAAFFRYQMELGKIVGVILGVYILVQFLMYRLFWGYEERKGLGGWFSPPREGSFEIGGRLFDNCVFFENWFQHSRGLIGQSPEVVGVFLFKKPTKIRFFTYFMKGYLEINFYLKGQLVHSELVRPHWFSNSVLCDTVVELPINPIKAL